MTGYILLVFGTRPEGLKMLALVQALRSRASLRTTVPVTGQHRELLEGVRRH